MRLGGGRLIQVFVKGAARGALKDVVRILKQGLGCWASANYEHFSGDPLKP